MEYILVFINTHDALHCEKVLEEMNFDITILPTPSYITNSCGISIGIKSSNLEDISELITNEKINIKFIYDINKNCVFK